MRNRLLGLSVMAMPLVLAGCDDDDFGSREIISIIFAVGEVIIRIIEVAD